MKTEKIIKTWNRTPSWPKGLLQHKGGYFYARLSNGTKTVFRPLRTSELEVAKVRCTEATANHQRNRKAARRAGEGVGTMGDLLELYRARVMERADIKPATRTINLCSLAFFGKTWPGFAELKPADITATAIEAWKTRALTEGTGYKTPGAVNKSPKMDGRSASSFNKALDALRRILDLAVDAGALHANILAGRRGLKAKNRPRKPILPETAVIHRLFAEVESVGGRGIGAAEFLRLLTFTGCRRGEAAALRWQDVDFDRGVIRVHGTKTDAAAREVPMIPAARQLLEQIRSRRESVTGKPVNLTEEVSIVGEAQKSLDRACAKLKVERLTHHDLRDAFATTCIESGVDVPTVAAWLGHADGGALLMRVYQHHRRPHSLTQAAKVNFGGVL